MASDRPLVLLCEVHGDYEAVDVERLTATLDGAGVEAHQASVDGGVTYKAVGGFDALHGGDNMHVLAHRGDRVADVVSTGVRES